MTDSKLLRGVRGFSLLFSMASKDVFCALVALYSRANNWSSVNLYKSATSMASPSSKSCLMTRGNSTHIHRVTRNKVTQTFCQLGRTFWIQAANRHLFLCSNFHDPGPGKSLETRTACVSERFFKSRVWLLELCLSLMNHCNSTDGCRAP